MIKGRKIRGIIVAIALIYLHSSKRGSGQFKRMEYRT